MYRLEQAFRALFAFTQPVDLALASRHLPPPLLAVFRQMTRDEQLHSLNVLRDLLADGAPTPPALARAALLHDVGKSRYPMQVWQRSLGVAVRRLAPALAHRLAQGDPAQPIIRPFVVRAMHPAWSADLIAAALEDNSMPSDERDALLWLVTHHQDDADQWRDHPLLPLLQRLQRADDAN